MLSNEPFIRKIGFDTAENEPSNVWATNQPSTLPSLGQKASMGSHQSSSQHPKYAHRGTSLLWLSCRTLFYFLLRCVQHGGFKYTIPLGASGSIEAYPSLGILLPNFERDSAYEEDVRIIF